MDSEIFQLGCITAIAPLLFASSDLAGQIYSFIRLLSASKSGDGNFLVFHFTSSEICFASHETLARVSHSDSMSVIVKKNKITINDNKNIL